MLLLVPFYRWVYWAIMWCPKSQVPTQTVWIQGSSPLCLCLAPDPRAKYSVGSALHGIFSWPKTVAACAPDPLEGTPPCLGHHQPWRESRRPQATQWTCSPHPSRSKETFWGVRDRTDPHFVKGVAEGGMSGPYHLLQRPLMEPWVRTFHELHRNKVLL